MKNFIETDPLRRSLKESFRDFKNKLHNSDRKLHGNFYSLPKSENERIEVSMMKLDFINDHRTSILQQEYRDEIKESNNYLPCILFINEQIYDNTGNDDIKDLKIYNDANTLDKTTYLVLNKLSKEILKGNNSHKKYIDEIFSSETDLNIIKLKINDFLSTKKYTKDIDNLIQKFNNFFNLTGKSTHISEDGFIFFKEGNNTINWYQCSKGEKNLIALIVLAYLNRKNKTVFILDEPDLSMHIEWQELLIPTLLEICPNHQFFISTHSPSLIPDYRDNIQFFNMNKIKKDLLKND